MHLPAKSTQKLFTADGKALDLPSADESSGD